MENRRLFVGAPVVINFHAVWVDHQGWRLTARALHDFQTWDESRPDEYSGLGACELDQVITMTCARLLNL